ncbi:hypothetical protein BD626DRAFT_122762 [Schizophyllum amplum]|uniref:Uncharacterized protein n=1 Tax=Schizophyllum amplum TaxID=97359 RepID=A0A550C7R2_9AGAR|nr:hypothetical protein BD626DRAFT_122762 [Auriculariopsis ampla]
MQPSLLEDSRRRKINLGGTSGASSQSALLDQAKARRLERRTLKRKQDSAVKIQSWWRGIPEPRSARRQPSYITSCNSTRTRLVGTTANAIGCRAPESAYLYVERSTLLYQSAFLQCAA